MKTQTDTSDKLQFSWSGFLLFKPFDESNENHDYIQNPLMAVGVVASFLFTMLGMVLIFRGHPEGLKVYLVGLSASSVTAGLEWQAGMRARALNQLYVAVFCLVIVLFPTFGA